MQSVSTKSNFSVRSANPGTYDVSSRMTCAGALFLSTDTTVNRVLNTPEDVRACDTGKNIRSGIARNQGIIDTRCKAVRGRLYAEVQRRKVQQSIDHLDTLMQKLLESQDPANEKMYDLYAQRKAQLETQL
jgi:alpha-D-ribose 1-methylphosphonate 5-triphosphate synthase subunit PhnG